MLEVFNFKISLRISSLFIFEKENGSLRCLLHTSTIASMLVGSYILQYILKQDHLYCLFEVKIFCDIKITDSVRKESVQNLISFCLGLIVFQNVPSLILFSLRFLK